MQNNHYYQVATSCFGNAKIDDHLIYDFLGEPFKDE